MTGASAVEDFRSCESDGHILNSSVLYNLTSTQHRWSSYNGKISGSGTGGKSNLNMRVRVATVLVWSHNSADGIDQNDQYEKSFEGLVTDREKSEVLKLTAIFDEPGFDDQCTATWSY